MRVNVFGVEPSATRAALPKTQNPGRALTLHGALYLAYQPKYGTVFAIHFPIAVGILPKVKTVQPLMAWENANGWEKTDRPEAETSILVRSAQALCL
jgi:hypothetical protein